MNDIDDGARWRFACDDIHDRDLRERHNRLLERMGVMSYSAASRDMDILIAESAAQPASTDGGKVEAGDEHATRDPMMPEQPGPPSTLSSEVVIPRVQVNQAAFLADPEKYYREAHTKRIEVLGSGGCRIVFGPFEAVQPKCGRCDDTGCPDCDPEWAQYQRRCTPEEEAAVERAIASTPSDDAVRERAAWLLECYAQWIRANVGAARIEEHPYLPEIDEVAELLRQPSRPQSQPERGAEPVALTDEECDRLIDRAWGENPPTGKPGEFRVWARNLVRLAAPPAPVDSDVRKALEELVAAHDAFFGNRAPAGFSERTKRYTEAWKVARAALSQPASPSTAEVEAVARKIDEFRAKYPDADVIPLTLVDEALAAHRGTQT